ncbi:methyltransferase [Nostoc sp. WHI]|uniref:methyltransferase n=1 Tax=Nostoc sp. WHI TaxID=2650611 RepID=UPI0018C7AC50|nr:methyltransferase [Nostoc sp. WHI]MBG1268879.1 methyltransferase [Nostoc sp. WHI]
MLSNAKNHISPQSVMLQISLGEILSQGVCTIIKLNIPDLLADSPKTAEELAQLTNSHERSLDRLLRFLTSLDIFAIDEQERFTLTPFSDVLRTDNPTSPRDWILFNAEPWRWELLQSFEKVIATGLNAYDHIYQKKIYEVFSEKQEYAIAFNKAMKSWSSSLPSAVVNAYAFQAANLIVDVGGGMGDLLVAILSANKTVNGILFDQPHVIQEVHIANQEIATRCNLVSGDFLKSVPPGGDVYIISHVLMDWSNEDCITILKNCRASMIDGGSLLIIEAFADVSNEQVFAHFIDMIMLQETSGRVRTLKEWNILLGSSGFTVKNIIPIDTLSMNIIEAV